MVRGLIVAWAAGVVVLPSVGHAAVLTEAFTIAVPAGTGVGAAVNVASSPFAQFDPSAGSLTSVQTSFSGSGSWLGAANGQMLELSVVTHGTAVVLAGLRFFFTPGSIQFGFSGSDQYLPELMSFIGSGTTEVDLRLAGNGGTFQTPVNSGTISYVYTPAASVPEPGSAWLACVGLTAMALVRVARF